MTTSLTHGTRELHVRTYEDEVTVIVPSYNAERYLDSCLESVLDQPEVGELIVVDDGSTDGTRSIAEGYAGADSRVKLLIQQNHGVSVARNNGISRASKRWLAFVDADDIVPKGAFAALCNCSERFEADLCYGKFKLLGVRNDDTSSHEFDSFSSGRVTIRSVIENLASMSPKSLSGSCWRMLFRTSFIQEHAIAFPSGIRMSEDYSFILRCLSLNPVISYTDQVVYLVRREGDSVTQRYQPHLAEDMDAVNEQLRGVCAGDERLMSLYWGNVAGTCWHVCRNVYKPQSPYSESERSIVVKTELSRYEEALRKFGFRTGMPIKKAILLKLALLSPWAFWRFLEVSAKRV